MKKILIPALCALAVLVSCERNSDIAPAHPDYPSAYEFGHDCIVLGDRLNNPYTVENMSAALASVYPTKASRIEVKPTNLYVRFLPTSDYQLNLLSGLTLTDHPLDYEIRREGDWYHDPTIPEEEMTWQYAVVPSDYRFPPVHYEIIDKCFISENQPVTRASDPLTADVDWAAVEREAFRLTGNSDLLVPQTKAPAVAPSGRIAIIDEDCAGGKPSGVSGVMVVCNSFVKFCKCYTDRDGYYEMDKTYGSDLRYRLVFKNEKSFSLGFNFILVPASVSTLGTAEASGVNVTITKDSDDKLFRRCVVNNAAYDYISRCGEDDLALTPPPSDLRIWIFPDFDASSAVMFHHGAILDKAKIAAWLGVYTSIIKFFSPDITIGTADKSSYRSIYGTTCHELAHSSHFAQVGTDWWNSYITYIATSFISTGECYGDGSAANAGLCELGESWAFAMETKILKERYSCALPAVGEGWWFRPRLFQNLMDRGLSSAEVLAALDKDVRDKSAFRLRLEKLYPKNETIIDQVFQKYE